MTGKSIKAFYFVLIVLLANKISDAQDNPASTSLANNHQQCIDDARRVKAENYNLLESNQNLSDEVKRLQEKVDNCSSVIESCRNAVPTENPATPRTPVDLTNSVTLSTGVYKFVDRYLSWENARRNCRNAGMDLVAIETREENDAIAHHANGIWQSKNTWTSGCWSEADGWRWLSTNQPFSYTHWRRASTFGTLRIATNCVQIFTANPYSWGEWDREQTRYSICELQQNALTS